MESILLVVQVQALDGFGNIVDNNKQKAIPLSLHFIMLLLSPSAQRESACSQATFELFTNGGYQTDVNCWPNLDPWTHRVTS